MKNYQTLQNLFSTHNTFFLFYYFLGSKSGVFKGSPKVKERDVEKVDSAKECAEACDKGKKCLFWEFTKKTKNCKISVFRSKT